ncbi:MAG: EAL domain-containing protein, partial [Pseudomonadota bacterium]
AANRNLSAANKAKSDAMSRLRDANIALEERAAELEEIHARIRHSALTDPLTGIANRRHLDERLAECAVQCRISGGRLGALHIDLDRFKQINDTMGHAAGDAVLCHVAEVLSRSVPEDDFVARVGGDEFVVICSGHTGPFALGSLANRIIDEFSRPLIFEDRELWFGASVGIATQSGEEIDPESILVNADVALYRAKANGRNGFQLYSEAVQREIVAYKATADGILAGLKRGEFEPWYQPQVCARTMEIIGFEALARWRASDGSVRVPAAFLSVAKDLGVMASIDRCIMERAVSEIMEWRREGLNCPRVSVNVSARRLMDADLIESLGEINLPRGILVFELLESVFLDDIDDQIIWNIDMLREMGIEVELDDFGSGHASLISLIRLSPDAIKIDRQLISAMRDGDKRSDLVRSIVDIGHSLGVRVIAEGVETDDVAAKLAGIGCDVLQGFFVSEPLPASQIPGFIRHWESRIGIIGDANTAPRTGTK